MKNPCIHTVPIVMISMSRWDGDFSSAAWSIAQTMAARQPVIYVDYPYTWTDYAREHKLPSVQVRREALLNGRNRLTKLIHSTGQLYALTPPLMLPVNQLGDGGLYRRMAGFNDRRLAPCILKAVRELGYNDFVFFNSFNPLYLSRLPENFRPMLHLYQSRDNIRALEPYLRKHGVEGERTCIESADLSFASSSMLQQDLSHITGKKVHFLPNAADFGIFKKAFEQPLAKPIELQPIKTPIIGYTGNICHRIDYELLARLCRQHRDKTVVMVGPRNHGGHTDIDLDAIPNLLFTGPRALERLPEYLAHFDVLILPFLMNELTKSIYPLKINEYLASGKPVVATPFSDDIRAFGDLIALQQEHDDFSEAITLELEHNTGQKARARHHRASENTWEQRVEQLRLWMDEALKHKQQPAKG